MTQIFGVPVSFMNGQYALVVADRQVAEMNFSFPK